MTRNIWLQVNENCPIACPSCRKGWKRLWMFYRRFSSHRRLQWLKRSDGFWGILLHWNRFCLAQHWACKANDRECKRVASPFVTAGLRKAGKPTFQVRCIFPKFANNKSRLRLNELESCMQALCLVLCVGPQTIITAMTQFCAVDKMSRCVVKQLNLLITKTVKQWNTWNCREWVPSTLLREITARCSVWSHFSQLPSTWPALPFCRCVFLWCQQPWHNHGAFTKRQGLIKGLTCKVLSLLERTWSWKGPIQTKQIRSQAAQGLAIGAVFSVRSSFNAWDLAPTNPTCAKHGRAAARCQLRAQEASWRAQM